MIRRDSDESYHVYNRFADRAHCLTIISGMIPLFDLVGARVAFTKIDIRKLTWRSCNLLPFGEKLFLYDVFA